MLTEYCFWIFVSSITKRLQKCSRNFEDVGGANFTDAFLCLLTVAAVVAPEMFQGQRGKQF